MILIFLFFDSSFFWDFDSDSLFNLFLFPKGSGLVLSFDDSASGNDLDFQIQHLQGYVDIDDFPFYLTFLQESVCGLKMNLNLKNYWVISSLTSLDYYIKDFLGNIWNNKKLVLPSHPNS